MLSGPGDSFEQSSDDSKLVPLIRGDVDVADTPSPGAGSDRQAACCFAVGGPMLELPSWE